MLDSTKPYYLHLSETKCSLSDIINQTGNDLKSFLHARGYNVYLFWCDNPGGPRNKWGSALLSKETPTEVKYGFGDGHEELDKEGRFILAQFSTSRARRGTPVSPSHAEWNSTPLD
jgi:exonuclease III